MQPKFLHTVVNINARLQYSSRARSCSFAIQIP